MKIRTIIIDDEPIAREGLKGYVERIEHLEFAGSFPNPAAASKKTQDTGIDLMFLDIQMPGVNGLDYLRALKNPPMTVITTAFPQYALDGFELDVMDYLVKPISFQKFQKAVNKVTDYFKLKLSEDLKEKNQLYFYVKSGGMLVKINFSDIMFVESLQNYVIIHTIKEKIIAYSTLKNIFESLPGNDFIRVHKSYIVSVNHIDSVKGSRIILKENEIKISRDLRKDVIAKMSDKILKR